MTKLETLISLCKCGIHLDINEHLNYYATVEEEIEFAAEINPAILSQMIERNTIIRCQFYPDTPVIFYVVYHYDLNACLTACLEILASSCPPSRNG